MTRWFSFDLNRKMAVGLDSSIGCRYMEPLSTRKIISLAETTKELRPIYRRRNMAPITLHELDLSLGLRIPMKGTWHRFLRWSGSMLGPIGRVPLTKTDDDNTKVRNECMRLQR